MLSDDGPYTKVGSPGEYEKKDIENKIAIKIRLSPINSIARLFKKLVKF